MTLQETATDLNRMFKAEEQDCRDRQEEIKRLKEKVDTLEKVIINLTERIDYLESRCQ